MKMKQITNYLLKLIRSGEKIYMTETDEQYVLTDGYICFFIPKDEMELNPNKFYENSALDKIVSKALDESINKEITLKNYIKVNNKFIAIFKNEEVKKAINDVYLKYFDLVEYYSDSDPYSPVLVKRNNIIVGFICPVRLDAETLRNA